MIRFLLVLAGLTAYTSVHSQKVKLINTAEVIDNGQLCSKHRYAVGYHGECKTYYSNGKVRERGSYDRGERHGVREKYGSLSSRENYVMGSRQGKAELFVKGSRAVEYKFNGGMTYE